MQTTPLTELEVLEADVKDKLLGLDASLRTPGIAASSREERHVRNGPFRSRKLRIFSPPRRHHSRRYGLSVDRAAHVLSSLAPDQARTLAAQVREIALLPELVLHQESLLTHVFIPSRGLLAFYLFPAHLLKGPADLYPERFRREQAPSAGMLPALIQTLGHVQAAREDAAGTARFPSTERLLKFLIPRDLIRPGEIQAMQEIHDHYQNHALH